jgi:3-phenylpropionate/trans-cinnamate dioxygenase ferredoxin reductase subunit
MLRLPGHLPGRRRGGCGRAAERVVLVGGEPGGKRAGKTWPAPALRCPDPQEGRFEEVGVTKVEYLIIGGGIAAQRACEGIRDVDAEGSILLVTAELHAPYQRPPLSKGYLMGSKGLDKVILKDPSHYEDSGVEVVSGVQATGVDAALREVELADRRRIGYEKLLLATGGQAFRLPIPGNDLAAVWTLRTIEDAEEIRQAALEGGRAVVAGGSFIGSEVASSLAQLGVAVTMVFPEGRLLERVVPEELSRFLRKKYEEAGVRILSSTRLENLVGQGSVEQASISDGDSHLVPADLVVMGVGIRLNTGLARLAGVDMDGSAVVADQYLRTSDDHIYTAGDIASWPDPTFGRRLRVEHWDVARRQGRTAGRNMAGEREAYSALPYFFSDLFDLSFEVWGDLSRWDRTVLRGSLESGSFAYYYFAGGRITGVLAAGWPEEERSPMQELIKKRGAYEDLATGVSDESTRLASLLD